MIEREIKYLCQINAVTGTPYTIAEELIRIIITLEDRVQTTESEIERLTSLISKLVNQHGQLLTYIEEKQESK